MVQLSLSGTVDKQGSFNVAFCFLSCQLAISSENLVASTSVSHMQLRALEGRVGTWVQGLEGIGEAKCLGEGRI